MGKVAVKPGEAEAILDALGVEALCDRLVSGETQTAICRKLKITRGSMRRWIALVPVRMAAVHEARVAAAQAFDELAEEEIRKARGTIGIAKARELAHHYRWRASKADPGSYGDKLELAGNKNSPLLVEVSHRPKLSRAEWLAAHGVGTAARPAE